MKKKNSFRERQVSETNWFWFLLVMGLLTRIPLLEVFKAETTDGILCLTYFSKDLVETPRFIILPGYSFLLSLAHVFGLPDWLWGRTVSALAGLLFLIPLWKFARRWVSVEMAGITCSLALFSPLLWQWSLKVMPDTLFLLAFWWSLERLTVFYVEKDPMVWWQAGLAGAVAGFTRPEGFLLLPWILILEMNHFKEGRIPKFVGMILVWTAPLYFLAQKFFLLLNAYREGLGLTEGVTRVQFPMLNFIEHFYAYLSQPLYVFTPLLFWFSILGQAKMVRRSGPEGEAFRKILLQVFALIFLSRLFPVTYQDRHMLPFLPLVLTAAAYHIETFFKSFGPVRSWAPILWKNSLVTLCLLWSALFSAAMFMAQNDSFGDIKRSAEFLKTLPGDAVIYSDEIPKTQYWSGRKVILMPYLTENTPFNPRPGDVIVLHSFYIPRIWFVDRYLADKHDVKLLDDEQSMVVPLLTDVMEKPELQNRVTATAFRFTPQFFRSRVYRVQK